MGKGLALRFKSAYPEMSKVYVRACAAGEVRAGRVFPVAVGERRWVLNFPTKRHWRSGARPGDIRAGLDSLVEVAAELRLGSVAIPALGCGEGGLEWAWLRETVRERLAGAPFEVRLYVPAELETLPAPGPEAPGRPCADRVGT
ncbi:hypothetical protein FNX44_017075 [Streptomyces sp. OF1]|nr:hypothetical protein [Streptomyces alkaliterrae]